MEDYKDYRACLAADRDYMDYRGLWGLAGGELCSTLFSTPLTLWLIWDY
jgi:hypothetical protein